MQSLHEFDTKKPSDCDRCYYPPVRFVPWLWFSFWINAVYEGVWRPGTKCALQSDERHSI